MQETLPGLTLQQTFFGEDIPPTQEVEQTQEKQLSLAPALGQDALFAVILEESLI